MGTRADCLNLTFRPETQAHCRWGSPNFRLTHDDSAMPPVDVMLYGGPNQPVVRTATESVVYRTKDEAFEYYSKRIKLFEDLQIHYSNWTPPKNPLPNPTEPTGTLVKGSGLEFQIGIWAMATGFSTYTDRPISVDMEIWKNGGTPFPPGAEYMVVNGLRFRFPIL